MLYLVWTIKSIPVAALLCAIGIASIVLATSQNEIAQYLQNLGEARRRRLITHLELGFNVVVKGVGKKGVFRTLLTALLVYSVLLPPLALFIIPVAAIWGDGTIRPDQVERQWMLVVGYEIWLWGNVLCDTLSFVVTRNIVRRLLVQLKRGKRSAFAVVPAAIKSAAVSLACLIVAAYATAAAYVFELKQDDWLTKLQKFTPSYVYDLMVAPFAILGWPVPIPPHLVVTSTSFVVLLFLFTSFSALAIVTSLAGAPLIKRIGNHVNAGDTTKGHILTVLGIVAAASLCACTFCWI